MRTLKTTGMSKKKEKMDDHDEAAPWLPVVSGPFGYQSAPQHNQL